MGKYSSEAKVDCTTNMPAVYMQLMHDMAIENARDVYTRRNEGNKHLGRRIEPHYRLQSGGKRGAI